MSIEIRLKKLEQYLKLNNNNDKTDFSNITDEELDILINAHYNNTLNLPEIQAIYNKINWGTDAELENMTDEELEVEIERLI